MGIHYFNELTSFFNSPKPQELSKKQFDAIKLRWGFKDGTVYRMNEVIEIKKLTMEEYFPAEQNLIQLLGFNMSSNNLVIAKWKKL